MPATTIITGFVDRQPEVTTTNTGKEYVTFTVKSFKNKMGSDGSPLSDYFKISAFGYLVDQVTDKMRVDTLYSYICDTSFYKPKDKDQAVQFTLVRMDPIEPPQAASRPSQSSQSSSSDDEYAD